MPLLALNRKMYNEAHSQRMSFSRYLEIHAPAPEGSKMDAFQLQLKERDIVTRSDYARGIAANTIEEAFYRSRDNSDSDILFPEFIGRTVREVMTNDILLSRLIGQYTTITGNAYKTIYCEDEPAQATLKRVTEGADLPKAKIKTRTQEVKIWKYGRAIEASYEVIRRMQIDLLAKHIARFGRQAAKDKTEEVLTILKDGDGNNNAAPILRLRADMDPDATVGTLTAKGWINFLMQFEEFPADTLVCGKEAFMQMILTDLGSITAADVLKLMSQGATTGITLTIPQLPKNNMNLFWHENVDTNYIYGINTANSIEQVTEAGSDIQEADRFITNQTQVLTISENSGFSKMFKEGCKILNINA
jgi:hypothetical protein